VATLPAAVFNRPIPNIETNIRVHGVTQDGVAAYFLPESMLVIERGQVRTIDYSELQLECKLLEYVETGGNIFPDSKVVDKRWRYINRDGSPDKRFKQNVELPVVRCGVLRMELGTTPVKLMTTNPATPVAFRERIGRFLGWPESHNAGRKARARERANEDQ
jgi:hypothetical protein